jgi:hypothetical protein
MEPLESFDNSGKERPPRESNDINMQTSRSPLIRSSRALLHSLNHRHTPTLVAQRQAPEDVDMTEPQASLLPSHQANMIEPASAQTLLPSLQSGGTKSAYRPFPRRTALSTHQASTNNTDTEKQPASFLTVPPETRNRIYELVLPQSVPLTVRACGPNTWNGTPRHQGIKALIQTCRQVRSEATSMYYYSNRFRFNTRNHFPEWLMDIGPSCGFYFKENIELLPGALDDYQVGLKNKYKYRIPVRYVLAEGKVAISAIGGYLWPGRHEDILEKRMKALEPAAKMMDSLAPVGHAVLVDDWVTHCQHCCHGLRRCPPCRSKGRCCLDEH